MLVDATPEAVPKLQGEAKAFQRLIAEFGRQPGTTQE